MSISEIESKLNFEMEGEEFLTEWKLKKLNLMLRECPLNVIESYLFKKESLVFDLNESKLTSDLEIYTPNTSDLHSFNIHHQNINFLFTHFFHEDFLNNTQEGKFLIPYYLLSIILTKNYKGQNLSHKHLYRLVKEYLNKYNFIEIFHGDNFNLTSYFLRILNLLIDCEKAENGVASSSLESPNSSNISIDLTVDLDSSANGTSVSQKSNSNPTKSQPKRNNSGSSLRSCLKKYYKPDKYIDDIIVICFGLLYKNNLDGCISIALMYFNRSCKIYKCDNIFEKVKKEEENNFYGEGLRFFVKKILGLEI